MNGRANDFWERSSPPEKVLPEAFDCAAEDAALAASSQSETLTHQPTAKTAR